jgi:hypothetical protein
MPALLVLPTGCSWSITISTCRPLFLKRQRPDWRRCRDNPQIAWIGKAYGAGIKRPSHDGKGRDFGPRTGLERKRGVQEIAAPGDDLSPTLRIESLAVLRAIRIGNGVRAIERIIERTPAGIRGIQREAGIPDRDD